MRISLPRADLSRLLTATTKVVESRNTIPILSTVLLSVSGGRLTLKATDLKIEAEAAIAVIDAQDGAAAVDAKMLVDIVKKSGVEILLEVDGSSLVVKSGRSRFKLPVLPAEDFPSFGSGEFEAEFSLDIAEMFAPVVFAISTEETRFYLNGVFFHIVDDRLCAVATDGHRLALRRLSVPEGAASMPAVIVPRKMVGMLPKGVASVSVSERRIRIETDDVILTSKLIDGTFPDYQRVIPTGNDKAVSADRTAFRDAADRVAVVSSDRGRGVKLTVAPGSMTFAVRSEDGEGVDEIEVEYAGEPIEIGFQRRYLAEALAVMPGGPVTLALNDSVSPALLTSPSDDGLSVTLMPLRV